MIIVDNKLNERELANNPIKVGIVGAGEMAKGLINQITRHTAGMKVIATFNRSVERPINAYKVSGIIDYEIVETSEEFKKAIESDTAIITQNLNLLIKSKDIDIIVDMTGSIEFSAKLTLDCIKNGKDILSFNAELDATLGPILKYKADKAGVKYSVAEGDQPGVTLNLFRFVKQMGFKPLVCGNIKGMLDEYRTPSTQKAFAESWGMSPVMATNFADGTKVSCEQACIANATGMKVAKRGMLGYESKDHIDNLTDIYDVKKLEELGGVVDFIVGAKPGPGVFVYATSDDPLSIKYLDYGKLGKGPLYSFYIPYHLLFFEIPISIARMVDFNDTIVAAIGGPVVDVITIAKTDLKKGDKVDEIGGYKTYGVCENSDVSRKENLLPMGLAEGCHVLNDIPKDQALTFGDVELPLNRLCDELWNEQEEIFNKK
ncbi:NAD(P)H-dependent oxidoreductase [Aureibaculum luteum]|uniref:NAD(P)H-dependent oxidoreductase n=1 Tax=Aureibaculum luteum TaxID=1548456 RepID=UPI000E4A6F23|nr:NAD(P)-dependent oxidoreductase [Aureibaculum luteum]